jgi:putative salt-induced outer membrane protein YdiY
MIFFDKKHYLVFTICALTYLPVHAKEGVDDWRPPEDGFDWIKLESGEWLKGEVKSMYNDTLEFDSDNLDLQKIDWADVLYLRSAEETSINIEGIGPVTGRLLVEQDSITIDDGASPQNFDRTGLVSLSPSGDSEIDLWAVDFTLSLNIRRGNTDQVDYTSRLNAKRRTDNSRVTIDYVGNISKTDAGTGEYVETVNNNRVTAGWDIYATRYFYYTPLFAEYYRDPFQNIDQRVTVGVGIGYTIIDTSKVEWNVNGGPAYTNVQYISVEAGQDREVDGAALVLATDYSNELSSYLDFSFGYHVTSASSELGGYSHHMIASLQTELTSSLDFDVSLMWDRVGEPTADADGNKPEPDDYRMMLGLSWSL